MHTDINGNCQIYDPQSPRELGVALQWLDAPPPKENKNNK